MAAVWTAHHMQGRAVTAYTESGSIPLWMSRLNCGLPIYALTTATEVMTKMCLYRGVHPLLIPEVPSDLDNLLSAGEEVMLSAGVVAKGDIVVLTAGEQVNMPGATNTLKIVRVGERNAQPALRH